jgi:hypothetical protein
VAPRKDLALRQTLSGAAGVPSGVSVEGTEEDMALMNLGLQMDAEGP